MRISLSNTIHSLLNYTWPMVLISLVVLVSLRVTYIIKNKEKIVLYKELLKLLFVIYILCLFQIVTMQDINNYTGNNFIPFKEITRYNLGSRLFIKNVLGNILLFVPYGFLIGLYLKPDKYKSVLFLTLLASLSIELIQLAIGRIFDIDDIILNILGGMIGFILYKLLSKMSNHLPKIFKSELFLNILMIIIIVVFGLYIFF